MDNAQSPVRAAFDEGAKLMLVGESPRIEALRSAIAKVADTNAPLLITGEIGTGKELLARLIHQQSSRAAGPFVSVNCAAMSAPLFRNEVFGSDKVAFSGNFRRSVGRIEAAQGGTLFLDEIGELSLDMQGLLLRFLQEGTFERTGSVEPVQADVRLITATHLDLEKRCQAGTFRDDLYYRLNTLQLETPPLRERESDVELLAEHFLREFAEQYGADHLEFDDATRQQLRDYNWPGNIRELRNRIMQAVVMCDGEHLSSEHLEFEGRTMQEGDGNGSKARISLREKRQVAEREAITEALRESQGQVPAAAAALGISRAQLYRLIGRLRVDHHHPMNGGAGQMNKSSPPP